MKRDEDGVRLQESTASSDFNRTWWVEDLKVKEIPCLTQPGSKVLKKPPCFTERSPVLTVCKMHSHQDCVLGWVLNKGHIKP